LFCGWLIGGVVLLVELPRRQPPRSGPPGRPGPRPRFFSSCH